MKHLTAEIIRWSYLCTSPPITWGAKTYSGATYRLISSKLHPFQKVRHVRLHREKEKHPEERPAASPLSVQSTVQNWAPMVHDCSWVKGIVSEVTQMVLNIETAKQGEAGGISLLEINFTPGWGVSLLSPET